MRKITLKKTLFRYGELNPGLAGLMLFLRAADASHYTITEIDIDLLTLSHRNIHT